MTHAYLVRETTQCYIRRMVTRLLAILFILLVIACENVQEHDPVLQYFPADGVFTDGYVNKIYRHYYPENPDAIASTEIQYTKYQKTGRYSYKTDIYNAGFQWTGDRYYRIEGDTLIVEKGTGVSRKLKDTLNLNIRSNVLFMMNGVSELPYQIQYSFDDEAYLFSSRQSEVYDSLILNKSAKVIFTNWDYRKLENDSIINQGTSRSYYVAGLGYFGDDEMGNGYRIQDELIEQMPLDEFEKRANHQRKRIAYIDPDQSLSDDSDFALCASEMQIADYYNARPNAQYLDGKREMERIIHEQVDPEKLLGQNGMLTFRFVVNCIGETGRFITEQVDFDYQRMQFSQEAVDHLLEIMVGLKQWQPLVVEEEPRDAYVYITFKIQHGEIIDILP